MSNTYEQLEHFAGCVNLILGGESMSLEQMVRKISGLKANVDYYTEWASLSQDVEDLAGYAGIDISDCESPNKVCALVLAEMKKRLMPDGCEWPRFEDGEQVRFGDKFMTPYGTCSEVAYITFIGSNGYELAPHGFHTVINSRGHDASIYYEGQRVRRPFILAKDGEPIEVGQTLYGEDGHAFEVVALHPGDAYDVEVDGEWHVNASGEEEPKRVKANWLTHKKPVLAADGKPIKVGETVYRVDGVDGNFVAREVGINPWNKRWDVTVDCVEDRELYTFEPSQLSHEKPCPENPANGCGDTWKAWEDDLRQIIVAAKKTGLMTEPPVATIIGRAKALADFGADTGIDRSGEVE